MKRILLFSALFLVLAACKKHTTTNNYVTTEHFAAFTISGFHDIVLKKGDQQASIWFDVNYNDSASQKVNLSLSGLPQGITVNDDWIRSGYPTFSTRLYLYDTSSAQPAAPGEYNVKLIAEGETSGRKEFPFKLTIQRSDTVSCTEKFAGVHTYCFCKGSYYLDTCYADATIKGKVWFSNFGNTGKRVYAFYACDEGFEIPRQVVDTIEFAGSGTRIYGVYHFQWSFTVNVDSVSRTILMN